MPLPIDEAGWRELEPKCADRESPAARRTVRQLREEPQRTKLAYMCNCVILGLANLVRCATEAGVSANTLFPSQTPVLVRAAQQGHSRVVRFLLDAGADCNAVDAKGCTALHRAAQGGHLDCEELLLAAGADPEVLPAAGAQRADDQVRIRPFLVYSDTIAAPEAGSTAGFNFGAGAFPLFTRSPYLTCAISHRCRLAASPLQASHPPRQDPNAPKKPLAAYMHFCKARARPWSPRLRLARSRSLKFI